ncbi:MAG: serine/threonine protein kinase [Candidatus Sumerlaeia bacterium]
MTSHASNAPDFPEIPGYRMEEVLARGRNSSVYRAIRESTGEQTAVKVLHREPAQNAQSCEIFLSEAEYARKIKHESVPDYYASGETDEGLPWIALEYVDGSTLDQFVGKRRELSPIRAVDLMLQACRGLDAAYRARIIHLDLKPANLILTQGGECIKITDFGLGREISKAPSEWMHTHKARREGGEARKTLIGTPRYMSPEQALGAAVDHRSDIYSLGATFYYVLTRRTPWEGLTDAELLEKQARTILTPIHELNPELPQPLCDLIMDMMERDPNERPQDYAELESRLEQIKLQLHGRDRPVQVSEVFNAMQKDDSLTRSLLRLLKKRPGVFLAGCGLLIAFLLFMGSIVYTIWR